MHGCAESAGVAAAVAMCVVRATLSFTRRAHDRWLWRLRSPSSARVASVFVWRVHVCVRVRVLCVVFVASEWVSVGRWGCWRCVCGVWFWFCELLCTYYCLYVNGYEPPNLSRKQCEGGCVCGLYVGFLTPWPCVTYRYVGGSGFSFEKKLLPNLMSRTECP